jgi:hypothetical protein
VQEGNFPLMFLQDLPCRKLGTPNHDLIPIFAVDVVAGIPDPNYYCVNATTGAVLNKPYRSEKGMQRTGESASAA